MGCQLSKLKLDNRTPRNCVSPQQTSNQQDHLVTQKAPTKIVDEKDDPAPTQEDDTETKLSNHASDKVSEKPEIHEDNSQIVAANEQAPKDEEENGSEVIQFSKKKKKKMDGGTITNNYYINNLIYHENRHYSRKAWAGEDDGSSQDPQWMIDAANYVFGDIDPCNILTHSYT